MNSLLEKKNPKLSFIKYVLGLTISLLLGNYIYTISSKIALQSTKNIYDILDILYSTPVDFLIVTIGTILLIPLSIYVVFITLKWLFKPHRLIPLLFIFLNIGGFYYGYDMYTVLANIIVLLLIIITYFIVTFFIITK